MSQAEIPISHALTARVAVDAAVTALMAVLAGADAGSQGHGAR